MVITYNPEISRFFGVTSDDPSACAAKQVWLAKQHEILEHLQEVMRQRGAQWDYTLVPREGRDGEAIFWFSGYTAPSADGTRIRVIGWCTSQELLSDEFPQKRVRVEPSPT